MISVESLIILPVQEVICLSRWWVGQTLYVFGMKDVNFILLSVWFLTTGTFNLLFYTDKDQDVPEEWEESGPSLIPNSQEVKLRSFTTSIHKVEAAVCYKNDDWTSRHFDY